jgi:hypothetical protein
MAYSDIEKNNIIDLICKELSGSNKSINTIIKEHNLPDYTTVRDWIRNNEDFSHKYACAKEDQADFLAEEIIEIADDSSQDELHTEFGIKENREFINRSRLRIDARKWVASKLKPKTYGDKIDHTTNGKEINQLPIINVQVNSNKTDFASSESEVDV